MPSILPSDRGQGPPCAQHPRLRQGLRTPVCPASSSQTGARDHPCAQHRVPQTDVSKAFSAQQCAHKGERECLQVSPQEPETTRAKTHHLLLAEPPGGGGSRMEAARCGGGDSHNSRKNGRLEKQKVPRCGQGEALRAGAVGQLVVRILLATVSGLGMPSRGCQHKVHQGQV